MSRSHQYSTVDPVKAATAIVRGVAGTFIAAFEDGYCKGYTDAMDDVMSEVAELSDDNDTMLSVTIGDDGKINIRKL